MNEIENGRYAQQFPVPAGLLIRSRAISSGGNAATHSHYFEPIDASPRRIAGRSRNWGDIDAAGQRQVVAELVRNGARAGLNTRQIAFLLAVARTESGFNPDAAARTSSAAGLGQFIDATGSAYGIKESKRFDLQSNVSAMISYLRSCLKQAAVKNSQANEAQIYTLAYGLYHDGPSLNYGGMEVARQNVLPWIDRYASWLDNQPVTGP